MGCLGLPQSSGAVMLGGMEILVIVMSSSRYESGRRGSGGALEGARSGREWGPPRAGGFFFFLIGRTGTYGGSLAAENFSFVHSLLPSSTGEITLNIGLWIPPIEVDPKPERQPSQTVVIALFKRQPPLALKSHRFPGPPSESPDPGAMETSSRAYPTQRISFIREKMTSGRSESEIAELTSALTFQKLHCGPRCDSHYSGSMNVCDCDEGMTTRTRRARTVATEGPNDAFEMDLLGTRPRKHSVDGSISDNRRKRSFSMCESDEDDELASLSSTASYPSSSKHQKLHDDFEDDVNHPSFATSDSVYWASSFSSASMNSSNSSMSEYAVPSFTPSMRMAIPKVNFPFSGSHTPASMITPSSSSRSSPRSSTSSPRSGPARVLPSVFKRAQSDGEVLTLRNSASQRDLNTTMLAPEAFSVRPPSS